MCLEISRSRRLIDVDIMMWYDSKRKDQSGGLIGLDCLMYNGTKIKAPGGQSRQLISLDDWACYHTKITSQDQYWGSVG